MNKVQERAREYALEIKLDNEHLSLRELIERAKNQCYEAAYTQGQRDLCEAAEKGSREYYEIAFRVRGISIDNLKKLAGVDDDKG